MQTIETNGAIVRYERALRFARQLMESKAQLEAEIRHDSTKPEYQDAIKQLRARKEERGTRLVEV